LTLADFTTQQKQEAERVCRSAGVTASAMLESCMFDVLVTGDRSFANVSAYVQSEVKVTANVTPITETTKPKPEVISNLISSATGVNYSKLRDLLAAKNWKDADAETFRVMAEAAKVRFIPYVGFNFHDEDIEKIPCEDLRIIDQLWVSASGGKWGFSVQKEIWKKLGSPTYTDKTFSENKEEYWRFINFIHGDLGLGYDYDPFVFSEEKREVDDFKVVLPRAGVFCCSLKGFYTLLARKCL
jgi:hypothetical protein